MTDQRTRILALVARLSQLELERFDAGTEVRGAAAGQRRQALIEQAERTRTRFAMAHIRRREPPDA